MVLRDGSSPYLAYDVISRTDPIYGSSVAGAVGGQEFEGCHFNRGGPSATSYG